MGIFARLVTKYLVSNPQVVERLASIVLHGLIEHISPSTVAGLVGEASASPLAGVQGLGPSCAQVISR